MQIRGNYCENCGVQYHWLAAGFYDGDQSGEVIGIEGKYKGRIYFYNYWPSEKEKAKILVKVRQNTKTKEIIEYIINHSQLV